MAIKQTKARARLNALPTSFDSAPRDREMERKVDEAIVNSIPAPNDPINHPRHYTSHPSGVECIQVTEHMNFCLGNAMKYIWRADEKGTEISDLMKAAWYINRELERRKRMMG